MINCKLMRYLLKRWFNTAEHKHADRAKYKDKITSQYKNKARETEDKNEIFN